MEFYFVRDVWFLWWHTKNQITFSNLSFIEMVIRVRVLYRRNFGVQKLHVFPNWNAAYNKPPTPWPHKEVMGGSVQKGKKIELKLFWIKFRSKHWLQKLTHFRFYFFCILHELVTYYIGSRNGNTPQYAMGG